MSLALVAFCLGILGVATLIVVMAAIILIVFFTPYSVPLDEWRKLSGIANRLLYVLVLGIPVWLASIVLIVVFAPR